MKRYILASMTAAALVSMTGAAFAAEPVQAATKVASNSAVPKVEKSKKKSKKHHSGTEQGAGEAK